MILERVRPAEIEDAAGIADVGVEAWKWAYVGVVPTDVLEGRSDKEEWRGRILRNWNPKFTYLVAVDRSNRVLGFSREGLPPSLPEYDAEIGSLYVHPGAARQGIGQALLKTMAKTFAARGCRGLCLQTLRDNKIGRSFYEKQGGKLVREDEWCGIPSVWYGWDDLSALTNPQAPSE